MLDTANFYWTVVVTLVGAVWVTVSFFRERNSLALERSSRLIAHLLEIDRIIIEHPDIQKYLASTANEQVEYFYNPSLLNEDVFFKSKSYVYRNLNIFDEILSASTHGKAPLPFLEQPGIVEISDWENYIKQKLMHPLYRSILNNEIDIFGSSLRNFWLLNRDSIESGRANPFMW